jgi:hypothetical protein
MKRFRCRWLAHLFSPVGFSIITISALQIIATPVPASAAPAPDRVGTLGAEAAGKPATNSRYCHDHSRPAVPSVVREHLKPPKKGDLIVKMGGQPPIFIQSPRISIPKRYPKS